MPPKKAATVVSTPGRRPRQTKTKAAETLRAIARSTRTTARSAAEAATDPPQPPIDPDVDIDALSTVIESLPVIQGLEDRFRDLEATMEDNQLSIRSSLADTFNQIMERLDSHGPTGPTGPATSAPPVFRQQPQGMSLPGADPVDVLSRWPWVDKSVVESISNGEFDIYDLPKLHREDSLRNQHLKKTTAGVHIPMTGKPEIITVRTKMQAAFKDIGTFFSVWMIYISIRSSFHPNMGPGLTFWSERLFHQHITVKHTWDSCLSYAIAYFQKHQNSIPESWYLVDSELHVNYFNSSSHQPSTATCSHSSSQLPKKQNSAPTHVHNELCNNWNRPLTGCTYREKHGVDCPRRHICNICFNESHKSFECPSKRTSP